jgi:hypothetical protein
MSTQDPDLLATLTDEEREAMADDGLNDQDRDALARVAEGASDAGDDDGEDDEEGDDGDDGEDDGADDAAADPAPAADQVDAPDGAQDAVDSAPAADAASDELVQYDAELPADFNEKWDGLKTRASEINQKFNDGEIDLAERDAELAKLQEEREAMVLTRARVENLQELNRQNAQNLWHRQIKNLFNTAAREGIDYAKDQEKAMDLDLFVKQLAQNPKNADKDGNWFLAEAHKRVKALHNITTRQDPETRIKQAKDARKPPLDGVPQNLAAVPGADGPGDVSDEFADVLSLEGQAYEDAIARMTPAQREKFLQG